MRRPPAGSTKDSRSVSDFKRHRPHRADEPKRDVNDIAARRQHDVGRGAALLADQLESAVLVRLVREHPPHQAAIDDRQVLAVARRQRQHRLAGGRAPGGGTTGGTVRSTAAIDGCVNGAGRLGTDAGPDGGARFIAGPEGASGTEAGGTGGGRSLNIWAGDGCRDETSQHRGKHKRREKPPGPPGSIDTVTPRSHGHAFHRKRGKFKPPARAPGVAVRGTRTKTRC